MTDVRFLVGRGLEKQWYTKLERSIVFTQEKYFASVTRRVPEAYRKCPEPIPRGVRGGRGGGKANITLFSKIILIFNDFLSQNPKICFDGDCDGIIQVEKVNRLRDKNWPGKRENSTSRACGGPRGGVKAVFFRLSLKIS